MVRVAAAMISAPVVRASVQPVVPAMPPARRDTGHALPVPVAAPEAGHVPRSLDIARGPDFAQGPDAGQGFVRPKAVRSAAFLAHLIATAQDAPQTRRRRRAAAEEAVAAYRSAPGASPESPRGLRRSV